MCFIADFANCMPALVMLCRRLQELNLRIKLFMAHRILYAVLSCEEAAFVLANTPSWAESLLCLAVNPQDMSSDVNEQLPMWLQAKDTDALAEEICSHVTSVIHIAVWKGVHGDVDTIWKVWTFNVDIYIYILLAGAIQPLMNFVEKK